MTCSCDKGVVYPMADGNHIFCELCPQGQKLALGDVCEHPLGTALFDTKRDRFVGWCQDCGQEFPAPMPDPEKGTVQVRAEDGMHCLYTSGDRVVYAVEEDRYYDLAMLGGLAGWFDGTDGVRTYYTLVQPHGGPCTIRSHSPANLIEVEDPKVPYCPQCKSIKHFYRS